MKPQLINALEHGLRGIKDSIVVGATSQIMVEQRAELVIATECLTLGMTVHVINVMPHGCQESIRQYVSPTYKMCIMIFRCGHEKHLDSGSLNKHTSHG